MVGLVTGSRRRFSSPNPFPSKRKFTISRWIDWQQNRINLMIVALKFGRRKSQSSDHDTIAWKKKQDKGIRFHVVVEQMLRHEMQSHDYDGLCNEKELRKLQFHLGRRNYSSGNENHWTMLPRTLYFYRDRKGAANQSQQQNEASILSAEKPSSAKSKWAKIRNRFELG